MPGEGVFPLTYRVTVSDSGLEYRLLDGAEATKAEDDVLGLVGEVYPDAVSSGEGQAAYARQFRVWRRQPGFALAAAWHGGYLVGCAAGMPLRPSTSWWRELTAPLPAAVTAEHPGRTFALTELAVRAAWRRQGIGRDLHDLILDGRREERAAATVAPGATAAQRAFQAWGWRKVGRTRGEGQETPVRDVLIRVG
jgi:GNAT superfamily N-acetyltransferase